MEAFSQLLAPHGLNGIIVAIAIACGYSFVKEVQAHRKDLHQINDRSLNVVDKNTEAMTELTQIIKERIPK